MLMWKESEHAVHHVVLVVTRSESIGDRQSISWHKLLLIKTSNFRKMFITFVPSNIFVWLNENSFP